METQFWEALQPSLALLPQIPSAFWKTVRNKPSLPVQLITKTVCQGAAYLAPSTPSSQISSAVPLSANQQVALKLCLSNSPLMVVQGVAGSGKTRLAQVLAQGLIEQHKRLLILTHHSQALPALDIAGISIRQASQVSLWHREQLQQSLGKLPMDFLPIHLLPDPLLAKLRSPRKLEKWLTVLHSSGDLISPLQAEFPECSSARINLLADRLQKLLPLLQQQLELHQRSARMSEEALSTLAQTATRATPVVGTVSDLLQADNQSGNFDWVIVEEAEYLSWGELLVLAAIAPKLILLGCPYRTLLPNGSYFEQAQFYRYPPFLWLGERLLPAYRYRLNEQFRLHFQIAQPVFNGFYAQRIRTRARAHVLTLPQLMARLQWQDVRSAASAPENSWQGRRVLQFMAGLGSTQAKHTGILAFTQAQRDWLRRQCPLQYRDVCIGSFTDWVGKECRILLVSCVGEPEKLSKQDLAIALTRAQDYLVLFGDYRLWLDRASPLQPLLEHIPREREVSLL